MAVQKIEIRPKGTGDYADILYPKTGADMVVVADTGSRFTGTDVEAVLAEIYDAMPAAETTTTLGALIDGATEKTTPVDADMVALMDSAASNVVKKLSWTNIKATLKAYFDTQYNYSEAYTHPTTAGSIHLPTGGATSNLLKYGGSSGTGAWAAMDDTLHGTRGGGTQHSAATTSVNGFMSSTDKTDLGNIKAGKLGMTAYANGNSSTAKTITWTNGVKQTVTLTGNCTFTFSAPSGVCNLTLVLTQDSSGSRTATWPSAVHWSGGTAPTLTTSANKKDIVTFYYDGTYYYGMAALNYA